MWKKDEFEESGGRPKEPSAPPVTASTGSSSRRQGAAIIGPSITIKGDVSGDEDLVIQGRIDGTVNLKKHNVTVGSEGRVKADIFGRTVTIEGEVNGDLHGDEQIVLRQTARVQGNIAAPRVTLEDGATFRGGIDMQDSGAASSPAQSVSGPGGPPRSKPSHESSGAQSKEEGTPKG